MYSKNLHSGHRERMRKRFLASGQDGLFEHELLELLLFYARPIVNTTGIAHALIEELGSFGKVLSSDTDKLKSIKGVGEGGAEFLRFMSDMGRAYLRSSHTSEALTTAEQLCACLSELSSENGKRVCTLLCLSHASELLRTVTIPADDILCGNIAPKEAAAIVLAGRAASVCIGISHGRGLPVPDSRDYAAARFIGEILSAIGVGFRDCIITGGGKSFSMRENGAFAF